MISILGKQIRADNKAQIFPFLTLVMIIMLVAVMAFVNIAQVNSRKVATMNAADAGALAGAAQLASAANAIADTNMNYLYEWYTKSQAYQTFLPLWNVSVYLRFGAYVSLAINNLLTYFQLLAMGYKAAQQAGAAGISTALANMPVDVAEERKGSVMGERNLTSEFSEKLRDTDFYTPDRNITFEYEWPAYYYNITEDKQMPRSTNESIRVTANKPPDNSFILNPAMISPQFTIYGMWIPPCTVDGCSFCTPVLLAAGYAIKALFATWWWAPVAFGVIVEGALLTDIFTDYHPAKLESFAKGQIDALIELAVAFLGPICVPHYYVECGSFEVCIVFYMIPIAYIESIEDNEAEIEIIAERFSPTRDLGLWRFKAATITSTARARMYGGNVQDPESYRIEMVEVE